MRIEIENIKDFPTLPGAAYEIMRRSLDPNVSVGEMAAIIQKDVALSTRILRTVNSPYYPVSRKVTNIQEALVILGMQMVKNITLSLTVMDSLRRHLDPACHNFLQERALSTAVASQTIAAETRQIRAEDAFLGGLLAGLGLFLIAHQAGAEFRACIDEARRRGIEIETAVRQSLQIDQPELGLQLAHHWNLSDHIKDTIRYHLKPEEAQAANLPSDRFGYVVMAHLGRLAAEIYTGWSKTLHIQLFRQGYRQYLNRSEDDAEEVLHKLGDLIARAAAGFEIPIPPPRSYARILEEANAELGRINIQYEQMYHELMAKAAELDQKNRELSDLTRELDRKNQILEHLAARDGLTDLYNHRYFQEFMSQQVRQARRYGRALSLVMLDIDHFKRINDEQGHQFGDLILRDLAAILTEAVRGSDIVARYGGEEFAVIMPDTALEGAVVAAEKIRRVVELREVRGSAAQAVRFTVSLGIAQLSSEMHEPGDLIGAADRSLYRAKNEGRNRVCA